MSTIAQPPVRVSPFIRGCRWIAFTSGIAYGVFNFNRLSKKEARFREIERQREEALKPKRLAAKKAEERETYLMLEREGIDCGLETPSGSQG